jgi:hypothetical protein
MAVVCYVTWLISSKLPAERVESHKGLQSFDISAENSKYSGKGLSGCPNRYRLFSIQRDERRNVFRALRCLLRIQITMRKGHE